FSRRPRLDGYNRARQVCRSDCRDWRSLERYHRVRARTLCYERWDSDQERVEALIYSSLMPHSLTLKRKHLDAIVTHALEAAPAECCGLIGGSSESLAATIYRLRNITSRPESGYEAAPEELFAAQRVMRERGEQLLAIYHSHPRAIMPIPSETDVRLAYYPS